MLWYQGETDMKNTLAPKYSCTLVEMLRNWREKWSLKSDTSSLFPFGIVQIAPSGNIEGGTCGNNDNCAMSGLLRWSQTAKYGYLPNPSLPNTYGTSAIDLGEPNGGMHPKDKKPLAKRLVDSALNVIYGQSSIYW